MKKAILLSSIWLFYCSAIVAPSIENVRFQQDGNQVIVTYDIVGSESWQTFDVELYLSKNNGYTYEKLRYVEGDVGFDVQAGYNKRIIWNALREVNQVVGDRIKFKVEATIKGKAPTPDNMVLVEGGTFQMGDQFDEGGSDEKPVHSVTVSSFYMSKYEITNAEYADFLNAKGNQSEGGTTWLEIESSSCKIQKSGSRYTAKSGYENHPVVEVSWYGAKAYCDWRTEVTGKKHRLPTEAEWEYAARDRGKKVRFGNGKNIADPREMNFDGRESYKKSYSVAGEYRGSTVPVNRFSPNALGLYNMSGNVWEWCQDWYSSDFYTNSSSTNPVNNNKGAYRVIRGGSWPTLPYYCRAAYRIYYTPGYRGSRVGFRMVVP